VNPPVKHPRTSAPSSVPSNVPSNVPTSMGFQQGMMTGTKSPTISPSDKPSDTPSDVPSDSPSSTWTALPSLIAVGILDPLYGKGGKGDSGSFINHDNASEGKGGMGSTMM
jgi:hypothetical protein